MVQDRINMSAVEYRTRYLLVEGDRCTKKGVDDVWVVVKLLVDHKGEDTHLGSTAVVQLDSKLLVDGLLVPARCGKLSLLDLLLAKTEAVLKESDEGDDLTSAGSGKGVEGSKTSLDTCEGDAVSDFTGKADASRGHKVTKDSKHGNSAVLGLNSAKTVESLLISIL